MPASRLFIALILFCACNDKDALAPDAALKDMVSADAALADIRPGADRAVSEDAVSKDAATEGNPPLQCFELSLDPELPLAIDGVFSTSSSRWLRPHSDEETCPASPTTAEVPFVAFAFCNNSSQAQTFDIELIASDGPSGEAPLDDPYLVLYAGRSIPSATHQCLAINDNIPDAFDSNDAEILDLSVPAGGAVTVVATTYTFDPATDEGTGYYILVVSKSAP